MPIEFRGYVPEDAIPELFSTTSILAMPYDSATGSSGPAHQACEFGIPIVCADIVDFHGMATDENMAIRFYKVGDAADLAKQLIAILSSHKLEKEMAEQNYAAGVEMTMTNVVNNYLRWFHLHRCKKAISNADELFEIERFLGGVAGAPPLMTNRRDPVTLFLENDTVYDSLDIFGEASEASKIDESSESLFRKPAPPL